MISKEALERAEKAGGKVTKKPKLPEKQARPEAPATPIPAPAEDKIHPEVVAMLEEQQKAAQQTAAELQALTSALTELVGPVRLKVHRDLDRESKTYLLITHLDVVPVEVKRTLNS